MRVVINTKAFEKQLTNIANYSFGFLDGVNRGKKEFLNATFIDGSPIDLNKDYRITIPNFFLNGGDDFKIIR